MDVVRVLLVSTYDLGRQPVGLASPAAWLRRAGLEVDCIDTSRERLSDDVILRAAIVAFYLPMHTATRLAGPLIERVRTVNPAASCVAYGLYAPLNADWLRGRGHEPEQLTPGHGASDSCAPSVGCSDSMAASPSTTDRRVSPDSTSTR